MLEGHESERDQVEPLDDVGGKDLPGDELVDAVKRGKISTREASEELQAQARRRAAERGPDLDTDEEGSITTGGFGAGQGMAHQSTGGRKRRESTGGET